MTHTTTRSRPLQLTAASLALAALTAQAQTADTTATQRAPMAGQARVSEPMAAGLIVKFRDGARSEVAARATMQGLRAQAQSRGLAVVEGRDTGTGARVIHLQRPVPARDLQAMARELMLYDPAIEYVEPNYITESHFMPNDTRFAEQYALPAATGGISATLAWDTTKGLGARVAVLDSGVIMHADLAANVLAGYDLVSNSTTAMDGGGRDSSALDPGNFAAAGVCGEDKPAFSSTWHGTHVAGIVGALGNNNLGVSGVAPSSKVVPVRVGGRCGVGTTADLIDGILWAAGVKVTGVPVNPNPVRVINISRGGYNTCIQSLQAAIYKVSDMGVLVVASAGNDNLNAGTMSPANCKDVLVVGASNAMGNRSAFSNFGDKVDISAPGSAVLSTHNTGAQGPVTDSYFAMTGTSMSAPHVAGVAALMTSVNPAMGMRAAKTLMKETATPFTTACTGCGTGIVNAEKAVLAARKWRKEAEPNNSAAQAQLIAIPAVDIWGYLEGGSQGDEDYFMVSMPPRSALKVQLQNNGLMFKMAFSGQNAAGQTLIPSVTVYGGNTGTDTRYNTSYDTHLTIFLKVTRAPGQSTSMLEHFYRLKVTREALPY